MMMMRLAECRMSVYVELYDSTVCGIRANLTYTENRFGLYNKHMSGVYNL